MKGGFVMTNYVLISDGSCDLTKEEAQKLNVEIVPFYVEFLSDKHLKEGVDIEVKDFYKLMIDNPGNFPKSSLPSPQDYISVFEKYLQAGKDIICLCITTKFSGSYNSALNAKQLLEDDYPERKITVIDTMVNTVLQGLVVREAARMRDLGTPYEELIKMINVNKETGRIFFTVKGLSYLQHGGRIGKLSSIIGDFLKITPLICLREGEIFSNGIAISRGRSLLKIREHLLRYLDEVHATKDTYIIAVGYGYDFEEAMRFKELISKVLPDYEIVFNQIGATIAVHTGPYPIGVGVLKKFN